MENKTFTRARENDHTADGDKMVSSRAVIDVIESFDVLDGYQDKVELVSRIEALPAQPEPKEGEWVQIQRCARDAQPDLECPFCKHRIGWFDMGRYCAGCGAKLKGGAG